MLFTKIENQQFQLLLDASSIPNRARLMSASSNLAASWLSIILSPGLNIHLDTTIFQKALMSNVLGMYRGARLYIAGYAKQSFISFCRFSILAMFDCFATLYKSLFIWAKTLKAKDHPLLLQQRVIAEVPKAL